jgi:hypothetical protein
MKKLHFITTIFISLLFQSCCSKDNNVLYPPQYVVIKSYGGFNLTRLNLQDQQENLVIVSEKLEARTIIDKGDTLCLIRPYYGLVNGGFNPAIKVLLVNKILNRTDTLSVKFSLKKVDSCNEYPVMDEATLNGKKGISRTVTGLYGDIIELKFK